MNWMTLWGGPVLWHQNIALTARWVMLAMTLWAAFASWQRRPLGSIFMGLIGISEVVIVVQAVIGAYFFLGLGMRPLAWMKHLLYGGLVVFTLPVIYFYLLKEKEPRRVARIWALACLFMFGLTFRTATTGVMG